MKADITEPGALADGRNGFMPGETRVFANGRALLLQRSLSSPFWLGPPLPWSPTKAVRRRGFSSRGAFRKPAG